MTKVDKKFSELEETIERALLTNSLTGRSREDVNFSLGRAMHLFNALVRTQQLLAELREAVDVALDAEMCFEAKVGKSKQDWTNK